MNFLLIGIFFISVTAATDKIVCYFGSWAVYRNGNGKFDVEDINPNLCTHIIYAFVGLNGNGSIRILDNWNEIDKNAIQRFVNLKQINPAVKLMVAIGGWGEGSVVYSNVVNNPALRSKFAINIVAFTRHYQFDGFDLDWEYPGQRGGAVTDRAAYIELLKELRPKFDESCLILSAAVHALQSYHTTSYNVPEMNKYLDFVNIMTYDFHGSYDGVTGQNAPLYASSIDTNENFNVDASIKGWIENGLEPHKLILGMGVYGRSFTLANPSKTSLGAIVTSAGIAGQYTGEPGMLSYLEICEQIKSGGWTSKWDNQQMVPFAFKNNQWVGYDNVRSIKIKTQYVVDMKLGGAMIWSIEMDDSKNICGEGKFPILQAINDGIKSYENGEENSNEISPSTSDIEHESTPPPTIETTETTTSPTTDATTAITTTQTSTETTAATTTTTKLPNSQVVCVYIGFVRDPNDCSVFYYCNKINSETPRRYQCQIGLYFDIKIKTCNYIAKVDC